MSEEERKAAKELMSECVKVAKEAWEENFDSCWNSGDSNREAIGRLADSLFQNRLTKSNFDKDSLQAV